MKLICRILMLLACFAAMPAWAKTVEYDLTIAKQNVALTGKPASAMTINGGIPGPVLRFREGDMARIHVRNAMDVETSIHWHGLLVPPGMDGVPLISFPPIAPGRTFTYEFPIRQSGTYWYHSHTSLQEQSGVYGGIVIEPASSGQHTYRDHVVLFSDWTDEDPAEVLRTLKRGSEWYAVKKRSGQSLLGAASLGMLGDYFKQELQRMPPMDISDVAYDRFLANGSPEMILPADAGETVRLRIIDGSATTYFHLEFSGGPMTIISADGQDVEPVQANRLLIAVAETYDILVTVPAEGSYELRATAHDGSGHASVWIGRKGRHPAPDIPRPNLYHGMGRLSLKTVFALTPAGAMGMPDSAVEEGDFDEPGMHMMGGMHDMHGMNNESMMMEGTNHSQSGHSMEQTMKQPKQAEWLLKDDISSHADLAMDGMDPRRPWTPYEQLRSTRKTAFAEDRQVREIRLTLDGDMERYVWSLNNRPLSESDEILILKGEVVRFIMINRTMMHHPMHLHGHFFRVVNSQGDYAPLKHTVNVAPMSTTVIEFDANEFGDWFFHCHLLYHMKSGMARVVHYDGYDPGPEVAAIRQRLFADHWYFSGRADILSNMREGRLALSNIRNILAVSWEAGWQRVDRLDWEVTFTWGRYFNPFVSVFAGADMLGTGERIDKARGILGLHYLLPLTIESRAWLDSSGGARIALEKAFDLTPRIRFFGEIQYDTHHHWEGKAGISYMASKRISLISQWHSEYGLGAGLRLWF